MRRLAGRRACELAELGLDGYVFKRASPSCGLFRVPVHGEAGRRHGGGRGMFAAALTARLPRLPVEEEGRLADPAIRENFIERVFASARWRRFVAGQPRARDLVAFHAAQKFATLAHSPAHYARLGRLVAAAGPRLAAAALDAYASVLMEALAVHATRGRHANVLQHLAGFFKRDLDTGDRAELADTIEEYRRGLVPLVVPLTLMRHHARRLGLAYLADQAYLDPHPRELMLRNHSQWGPRPVLPESLAARRRSRSSRFSRLMRATSSRLPPSLTASALTYQSTSPSSYRRISRACPARRDGSPPESR
jgi:uncharacterized protein YbgA (DUF1722 family)